MNLPHPKPRAWHKAAFQNLALAAGVAWGAWCMTPSAWAQVPVGLHQLQLGDLPVTLVYPTLQQARTERMGPFELQVALNAAPAAGSRRLVVLSHGSGGSASSDHALAATLARAGFVVAQPQHRGDNFQDTQQAGPESWRNRPGEVSRVIDGLAAHPQWQGLLRLDRVGVHGMSAGGVTALSLAGAQWRLLNLVQHCLPTRADLPSPDPGFCFFGVPSPEGQAQRQQMFEGARAAPEAYLPAALKTLHGGRSTNPAPGSGGTQIEARQADARPDPRIAAVTLAVPVAALFSAESLARITVPVGVVSAGQDRLLAPALHSGHVLRHCKSCSLLAHLEGAGHFDLLAPWPAELARDVGARQAQGGFPVPAFDPLQREAAWARVASFFQQHLLP